MRKRKRTIITLLMVTLLGGLLSGSAWAKEIKTGKEARVDKAVTQALFDNTLQQSTTATITGEDLVIENCETIDLFIRLENVTDLYAVDVKLEFDPEIVGVVDLDPEQEGVNLEPVVGLINAAFWAVNEVDNETGEIHYATTQYNPSVPASGSGDIARIRLQTKGIGSSTIAITEATLSDRDGYLIGEPVTLGSVTVTTVDLICLTLKESNDQTTWTPLAGDLDAGFIMPLDPANIYEYLDVDTFYAPVDDGDYPFYLDELTVPDGFFDYWADKGVTATAALDLQKAMWKIINGQEPIFYLRIRDGEQDLIDGLSYLMDGPTTTDRLKVNGDYPLGHYTFEGTIDGNYMIVDITFTSPARVTFEAASYIIDNCGTIDVYIRLENVSNLYAVDVKVMFDPTIVEVVDLDPNAEGINLQPVTGLIDAAYWVSNSANNATGEIHYATTMYNPSMPAEGSGNIAKFRLKAVGTGNSPITAIEATLSDRDGYLVGMPVELGSVTVSTQNVVCLTLKESNDDQITWETLEGDLCSGYIMPLALANPYEYIDVDTLVGSIENDGDYPFYLDEDNVPDDFFHYWAEKGVTATAALDWQIAMWKIITGQEPMFYLRVTGTEYDLIDGYSYLTKGSTTEDKLKVNGDYPLGHYTFEGTVDGNYMVVEMNFTRVATVTLGGGPFVIDGCGYLDLYIYLEDVTNLYALDVSLEFDPEFVEVVDLDSVASGINLEAVIDEELGFDASYFAFNEADNTTGTIRFTATQLNPAEPATGSGNVAMIRLRAKQIGESTITMTEAMLSDRDGYLVGLPVELGSEMITTQFSESNASLDLGIIRLDAGTVQLQWPAQSTDLVNTYTLHRSTLPYFTPDPTPGTGTVYQTITNNGTVATFDDAVLGNVVDNYFYTLQLTCDSDLVSPYAWQVGKFEYTLYETNTTDYSWIGFIFENATLVDSQNLANHIEDNIFSGQVIVKTVSRWNALSQGTTTYNHTTGTSKFSVFVKYPYRVEVDIINPATSNGTVIWAQVGRLPVITENTYTLYETNTTDFTWVLQPLEMTGITNTLQLADHIRANASASANVLAIGRWNGTGQSVTTVLTPVGGTTSFVTRFGYPYRVETDVAAGTTVTWP